MFNSRIFWKIYFNFILFIVLTAVVVGIFLAYEIQQNELRQSEQRLTAYAKIFSDVPPEQLAESSPALREQVRDLHDKLGVRLTVINSGGEVVADSDEDFSKMENHGDRPEIVQAREKGSGVTTRFSRTVQKNMMYVALPITDSEGRVIGYSRASFPLSDIYLRIAEFRNIGLAAVVIGALFALLFGFLLARQIVLPLSRMTELANLIADGNYEKRIPVESKNEFGELANALNTMAGQITRDIARRESVEAALQKAHDELEQRVGERTAELSQTNDLLNEQIAERKRAEAVLQASEERYRDLVENANDIIYTTDLEGRFTSLNKAGERLTDYTFDEAKDISIFSVVAPEYHELVARMTERKLSGEPRTDYEVDIITADGRRLTLEVSSRTLTQNSAPVGIQGIARDITERKRADAALRESEYKLRTLLDSMSEGLLQVSNDEVIEYVNDRFCEMSGYSREELLGKVTFDVLFDEEGGKFIREANRQRKKGVAGQYEINLRKKSGETLWMIVGGAPVIDAADQIVGSMGIFTDITERKRAEEQLLHDAFHDGLTGLANRALFMDHLRMTIERGKSKHSNPYAVLFLDFDRFKVVNDSLGHAEGDKLLNKIARRLESATRTGDLVARLGGDEFVVLLSELAEENDAVQIAGRIQANLKEPFDLSGGEIFITASIGIALSAAGHACAEDMVRDADIAMYRAKTKGRARYQIFDPAMHEHAARQLQIETEMRRALERGEFLLHYQPIINLETGTLTGFEALVRWHHPTRGMIPPFEFIGAAEENGLILPLGNWILRESCRQLREWQDALPPAASGLTVSVNLSSKQFSQFDLADRIAATLGATGLDPRCLKLEITESHIMENTETAVKMMDKLRSLGVELSLDDFGTGYSSLSYLHRLPVNNLKIDRSFVSRMAESEENGEIVSTIIKLAQNLKMKVVAEGIETAEQLARLKHLNCEFGQGYFFSKPLEAEKARTFIDDNTRGFSRMANQPVINLESNM